MSTISVITPSFNQGQFIERTIQSVLSQEIHQLEYVVVDGGSTDNTLDILKQYTAQIRWISEKDRGQTHAVNKGIEMTSGDIIGWINSDDVYFRKALTKILHVFETQPEIDVIYGDAYHIDADDQVIERYYTESWDKNRLKEICFLCQPAVFFRRSVIERFGSLNEDLQYCMDYEYWLRLAKNNARFHHLPEILAASRLHADTKTLGSSLKVHKEINDMLHATFKKVPDRWLSNYAHTVVGTSQSTQTGKAKRKIARETLLASLRWNKWISLSLLRMTFLWFTTSFKTGSPS